MEETKGLLTSLTFWGVLLSVVGKLAYAKGYDIGDTNGLAELLASLSGDALAVIGRIRATKRIGR